MKLAVTGGIAEGKSTVASAIREAGIAVASADEFAREAFESDEVQAFLERTIGGPPDADAVRQAMVADPEFRRTLNREMHPRIVERMVRSECPVIEVPLLIEACLQGHFERVWVVTCGLEEQLRRLADRLGGEDRARAMLSVQLPTRAKLPFADRIVRTNSSPDAVRSYVVEAIGRDL